MSSSSVVFHIAFLCIVSPTRGVEEAYRGMVPPDTFRDIVNQIWSSLKLRTSNNSKIQEYATIHKYLMSRARLHAREWRARGALNLTRLAVDADATYFTTLINEVLEEEKEIGQINYMRLKKDVDNFIGHFFSTLGKLKEILFVRNHSRSDVYTEVAQLLAASDAPRAAGADDELDSVEGGAGAGDIQVWVPSDSRRVYQGAKCSIKEYPFMASVHVLNQFACAGSIISEDLVITAASGLQLAYNNRFYRENPAFLAVRVGSSFYNGAGDLVPALEVYFHPAYDPKSLHNNLAIIRLLRNIRFHKKIKRVKRIEIDPHPWALPLNTDGITIIGWGATSATNKLYPTKSKLLMDRLDVYPLQDCQDVYSKAYVTDKHFCAGFVSRGGGACNRDVGAPGVVHGLLAGVASFGSPSCGAPDAPTVYTKLGFYVDWIEEIIEMEVPRHVMGVKPHRSSRYLYHTILSTTPLTEHTLEPIGEHKSIGPVHKVKANKHHPAPERQRDKFLPILNSEEFTEYKKTTEEQDKKRIEERDKEENEEQDKNKKNVDKLRNKENPEIFRDLTKSRSDKETDNYNQHKKPTNFKSVASDAGDGFYVDDHRSSERNADFFPNEAEPDSDSGLPIEPGLKTSSTELEDQIKELFKSSIVIKAGSNKKRMKNHAKNQRNKDYEENSDELTVNSYIMKDTSSTGDDASEMSNELKDK